MSEISKVPPYDPANPYAVLNPNAEGMLLTSNQNSAPVPPYTEILAESNAEVLGAGSPQVNGIFTFQSPKNYDSGLFKIGPVSDYPSPGVNSLAIMEGFNIYYYTEDTDSPIGKMFKVGSFGTAPAPGVVQAIVEVESGVGAFEAKEGKQPKREELPPAKPKEPSRKKGFFNY